MRRVLFLLLLAFTMPAHASDSALGVPDVFDPSVAKAVTAGQWLEYRVAYQVDPLENSLSTKPLLPEDAGTVDPVTGVPMRPAYEPAPVWRVLPLRLEVRRVEENGIQVVMRFEDQVQDLFIVSKRGGEPADFHYEAPQPEEKTYFHSVGTNRYDVAVTRRHSPGYGFVRWASPDLPFGLARFATENLDLILVGMGEGDAPEFPLADTAVVLPPPGHLYGEP